MATITTRAGKGAALTHAEVDANFTGLNTELGQKEVATNKGIAGGYASLDGSGKVPAAQLPSYVDDVVEASNFAALPGTGETGKIYVTLDNNKTYRWSGSAYVEISPAPGSTDSLTEGSTNLYFTTARARSSVSVSGSLSYNSSTGVISFSDAVTSVAGRTGAVTLTSSDVGLGNVENKSSATIRGELTSGNVTTALGYTPYNSSNPSGYITSSALSSYLPLSGGTLTGALTWAASAGLGNGNARSLVTGYSGGNYGQTGYGISYTTTSGLHNYAINDIVSMWEAYDGIRIYAAAAGAVGSAVTWTTVLDARRNNTSLVFKGQTVLDAANYNSYSPTLTGTGASGTWGINITGSANYASSAGSASTATRSTIEDTRAGQRTPNNYDDYRASYEFTNQIVSGNDWHTAFTMQGWHDDYAAWQIIGPASTSAHENWYLRSGVGTSWNALRSILHSGNFNSYALPLSGGTITGDVGIGSGFNGFNNISGTERTLYIANGNVASLYLHATTGSGRKYALFASASGGLSIYDATSDAFRFVLNTSSANFSVALQQSGNQVLHAGNYSSYALPLSGGTLSGIRPIEINTSGGFIGMTAANGGGWSMGTYFKGSGGTTRAGFGAYGVNNDLGYAWIGTGYDGAWMTLTPSSTALNTDLQLLGNYLRFDQSGTRSWNMRATGGNLDLLSGDGLGSFRYNGGVILTSNNVSSYALPIGGGNLTGQTTLSAGHNDTRFQLRYVHSGDVNSGGSAYLTMWASEPGITFAYTGLGANVNIGGQYYGRQSTGQTYGVYIRWDTASGQTQFWNTTGTPGAIGGQGTMRAYVASDGEIYATASTHKVLHAGNYTSYSPSLTGSGASGTWSINVTGSAGSASSAASATDASHITSYDHRIKAPSSDAAARARFGFTSWSNNNTAPWADYWHLRSYSDSSGGNDNLVMFRKDSIGMRIWQQAWGSASAYSNYVDVLHSSNYSSYALPLSGGTMTGAIYSNSGSLIIGQNGGAIRGYLFNDTTGFGILNNGGGWAAYVPLGTSNWQVNGSITASGNVTAYSDERVKANWRQLDDGFLVKLSSVKSGIYDRTDAEITQVGVSAQSLRDVLPHAVIESHEGDLSVAYGNAALVSAVELAKELVALKQEIAELRARIH